MRTLLKLKIALFLFFLPFYHTLNAQTCPGSNKKSNFWYFGINAGINFNSGSAVAVTNGQLNTREGVATMSDDNGNLLFYTDGTTVWGKNHFPMESGLYGNASSTQSAVIIPNPGNPSKYYIFTADIINGPLGYRYSEVDMSLNSGAGGVIAATKNTLLYLYHTEKITATKHANGTDYWIVVHENNNSNFRAYQVSSSGISAPVISTAGSTTSFAVPGSNSIGYLKFNKGGDLLIDVYNGLNFSSEIFNFNTSTGAITGPAITISPLSACYGAEFSDNGKYVYISELQRNGNLDPGFNGKGAISQYNLKAGNNAAINASRVQLVTSSTIGYGALQMGPDGKIYAAKENGYYVGINYLGVINNPDAAGTLSNYVENGLYLGGRQTLIGLPNFIYADYSKPSLGILGKDKVCAGDQETYTFTRSQHFDYERAVQGSGTVVTWGDTTATITFTHAGQDTIRIRSFPQCSLIVADTLVVTVYPKPTVNLGNDVTFCTNPFSYNLNAGSFNSYLWNTGSTASGITATTPGTYWVQVSNANNCINRDSIELRYQELMIDLKDTVICQHTTVVLQPGTFATYLWQDNSTQPTYTATTPGTYTLHVTNGTGCAADKSINISLVTPFDINLTDIINCPGTTNTLDAGPGFDTYTWQDGSQNRTFTTSNAGEYSVTVTRSCESAQDTVTISNYAVIAPTISGLAPSYCVSHEDVLLSATPSGGVFSGPGMTGSTLHIKNLSLGRTKVIYRYTDANGCTNTDTASTFINQDCFFIPNLITPNNDGQNDTFHVIGIGNDYTLEVYNRWGDLIYRKENYDNTFSGEGVSDGVYFFNLFQPQKDKHYKGWVQIVDRR